MVGGHCICMMERRYIWMVERRYIWMVGGHYIWMVGGSRIGVDARYEGIVVVFLGPQLQSGDGTQEVHHVLVHLGPAHLMDQSLQPQLALVDGKH